MERVYIEIRTAQVKLHPERPATFVLVWNEEIDGQSHEEHFVGDDARLVLAAVRTAKRRTTDAIRRKAA